MKTSIDLDLSPTSQPRWRHHAQRPRRLRHNAIIRDMVAQTHVPVSALMQPYFILPQDNDKQAIMAMPGIFRMGIEPMLRAVEQDLHKGLRQILLFGIPDPADKDPHAKASAAPDGVVPRAVRALKAQFGQDLVVATDVCLCAYTHNGHCGLMNGADIDNDASLKPLTQMACAHAEAGADIVAPSDMMDCRIEAMRHGLDAQGFQNTLLMSYSVKFASAYYGPFQHAADSKPQSGDRKTYQMDPRNRRDSLREIELDTQEGADILIIKPAMAYLDILYQMQQHTHLPIACYNVSGEYSMVKAAAAQGLIQEAAIVRENLMAMRRAGGQLFITYHATDAVQQGWLN